MNCKLSTEIFGSCLAIDGTAKEYHSQPGKYHLQPGCLIANDYESNAGNNGSGTCPKCFAFKHGLYF